MPSTTEQTQTGPEARRAHSPYSHPPDGLIARVKPFPFSYSVAGGGSRGISYSVEGGGYRAISIRDRTSRKGAIKAAAGREAFQESKAVGGAGGRPTHPSATATVSTRGERPEQGRSKFGFVPPGVAVISNWESPGRWQITSTTAPTAPFPTVTTPSAIPTSAAKSSVGTPSAGAPSAGATAADEPTGRRPIGV